MGDVSVLQLLLRATCIRSVYGENCSEEDGEQQGEWGVWHEDLSFGDGNRASW